MGEIFSGNFVARRRENASDTQGPILDFVGIWRYSHDNIS